MRLDTRLRMRCAIALMLVFPALAVAIGGARAEPLGASAGQLVLTDVEQVMVEENPALQALAATSPEVLREALDLIAAALEDERKSRGGLMGLARDDAMTLDRNPVLQQVWQSSPEASADLLELIRTAAGSGKAQK